MVQGSNPIRSPILQTKLQRPRLKSNLVHRPRLVNQLNRGLDRRLVLVSAPVGFGKTTLLSGWLEQCPYPGAWLSLDERDGSSLGTFLTYFVAALRSIFPESMSNTLALLEAPLTPPAPVLVATLINEINDLPQPFVIVLDDYQFIHQREVNDLISEFLVHWPQPMHLVIATRVDPMLPLVAQRAAGNMIEIRGRDLRFSRDEIAIYVRQLGHDESPETLATVAAQLEEQTEGWIMGLYLASMAASTEGAAGLLPAAAKISSGYLMEFLGDQILEGQPQPVQEFLLRTSILDRLCAPLAEAVVTGCDR